MDNAVGAILAALLGLFILLFAIVFFFMAFRPWLRALLYGTPVSVFQIMQMRLRGNPPMLLVQAYIKLRRAGMPVTIRDVEAAYVDAKTRISTTEQLVELMKMPGR